MHDFIFTLCSVPFRPYDSSVVQPEPPATTPTPPPSQPDVSLPDPSRQVDQVNRPFDQSNPSSDQANKPLNQIKPFDQSKPSEQQFFPIDFKSLKSGLKYFLLLVPPVPFVCL
jgi:hypothetical protein